MSKTFTIGDIHGNLRALNQCIERSKINKEQDHLIILGDIVDGYPDTKECIDLILGFSNVTMVLGNHDQWALEWMKWGLAEHIWTSQGGEATQKSYRHDKVPQAHIDFLDSAPAFYEENNDLFVHGGIEYGKQANQCSVNFMLWDREFAEKAAVKRYYTDRVCPYNRVFIGHTTTMCYNTTLPMHNFGIWNLDTGAGWGGKLTIMDVKTEEYWQSDMSTLLYPECKGRG